GGEVTLDDVPVDHLTTVFEKLHDAGVDLVFDHGTANPSLTIRATVAGPLRPVDVLAAPYPDFPTDLQAQWTALMTLAPGISRVHDAVFPDRFLHIPELARLGADVTRTNAGVSIRGGGRLRGANVMASDLRASAALVLAALVAEGETVIRRIYHLDRGYERLDRRLSELGAIIERHSDDAVIGVRPPA